MKTSFKKSFTLIELIFVIVIIGILSFSMTSPFQRDNLTLAFEQIKSHLELTQQLALDSDFYISDSNFSINSGTVAKKDARLWFKKMWQFQVHVTGEDSYSVYSDAASTNAGNNEFSAGVNFGEEDFIARDPQSQLLIIGLSSLTDENMRYQGVNIEEEYGVTLSFDTCTFSGGTTISDRVLFDSLGKPYCHMEDTYSETNGIYGRLATAQFGIELRIDGACQRKICIESISGFVDECECP
jgi:prepilin-type N-terminal cleavage/methylation domain-containing protein